ncbi:unnamed protein product [Oikopleura dioica]|uniref:Uncharacterized protein n=1 Tax=Oikopleura dioica TaxID=34765 RepID=E4YHL1_OIKDI|nr:unnamed protein product [Oikopleura dioica]
MRRSMDSPFKDRKAQLSIIREYKLSYDKMKREFPEDEEVIETKEESLNPVSCLRTTCGVFLLASGMIGVFYVINLPEAGKSLI